jgi:hypothetical protein
VIAWAHDIGMTQIGTATPNGKTEHRVATMDVVKPLADEYNKISEGTAKAGMQQFLHDEIFEMAKVDGRLVYQVLLEPCCEPFPGYYICTTRSGGTRRALRPLIEHLRKWAEGSAHAQLTLDQSALHYKA